MLRVKTLQFLQSMSRSPDLTIEIPQTVPLRFSFGSGEWRNGSVSRLTLIFSVPHVLTLSLGTFSIYS